MQHPCGQRYTRRSQCSTPSKVVSCRQPNPLLHKGLPHLGHIGTSIGACARARKTSSTTRSATASPNRHPARVIWDNLVACCTASIWFRKHGAICRKLAIRDSIEKDLLPY